MTADADPLAKRREADHMVREMLEEPTGSVDVLPLSRVLSAIERLEKWVDRRGRLLSSFVPKRATALMSAPTGPWTRFSRGSQLDTDPDEDLAERQQRNNRNLISLSGSCKKMQA
jgi:hypothetical protein